MQLKGFFYGLAVASLLWIGVPAAAEWATSSRSGTAQEMAQGNDAYSAVMQQEGQAMCPFQREAQRNMARCPYSGQARPGSTQGMRQSREPLEI